MADIRISALPQVKNDQQPVLDRAFAQRQDWGFATAPAGNGELEGLVRGLAALNPELERYNQLNIRNTAEEANRQGVAEANRMDMSQKSAAELGSSPLPSSVPPAFDRAYREGLKGVLGDRAGSDIKASMLEEYHKNKDTEGFNLGGFFSDFRARNMAGFDDPVMATKVGSAINTMEVAIRGDVERNRLERQVEEVNASFAQVVKDKLPPTLTPEELLVAYQNDILPAARAINKSPKDAAKAMLDHITDTSTTLGGAPQLFSVFDMKGAEGMTLAARNPEMAAQLRAAREQAEHLLTHNMVKDGQVHVLRSLDALDKQLLKDPSSITADLLAPMIGETNVFPTAVAAHSYLMRAQAAAAKGAGMRQLQSYWDGNMANRLPVEQQKELAEANLGPQVDLLFAASKSGDVTQVATLAESLMKTAALKNLSVPIPALERFIEVLNTTPVKNGGPDNGFKVQAALYKSLSANPAFRDLYYKEDARDIMDTYTKLVDSGTDPLAAYTSAYASATPEAKKAAEVASKDPKFIAAAQASVKQVVGSSFWPQWLGGNGRPDNTDVVQADAAAAMMAYKRTHVNASQSDLEAYAKGWVKDNYIHDTTMSRVIKVPRALANEQTQKAVSEYSKRLLENYKLEDREGNYKVEYVPEDANGGMQVYLTNGMGSRQPLGRLNVATIVQAYHAESLIDHTPGGEGDRLKAIRTQVESGTVDPVFLQQNSDLLAKARTLKALPADVFKKLDKLNSDTMLQRLKDVPAMSFGKPDFSLLPTIPQRSLKVDNKTTASVAQRFAMEVGTAQTLHNGLAASLVTMGEGVVLQSYPDPAKDAGNNIGTGYNLKANASNAASDLKRAGVPEALIQDVIDGKRQMTTEQVMRLTQIALPRYIDLAKSTAEKTSPGLWDKMTAPQKAVMVDIAYQVGSTDQFKQAWAALAKGDAAAFAEHAQTTYVNKAGERVKDNRRNSLRAAMLQGLPQWNATINKYGSFPSTAVDVAALTSQ